jgi:cystinosin
MGILTVLVLFLSISGIVCLTSKLTVLDYIYLFSYVKLAITIMKYVPQVDPVYNLNFLIKLFINKGFLKAYINYKRKSTVGWSILNVLLDFTGGMFSLLQMFFLAYNYSTFLFKFLMRKISLKHFFILTDDWTSIFGSPTKLGLGLLSILFDVVFMVQHYVLYRIPSEANVYTPIA